MKYRIAIAACCVLAGLVFFLLWIWPKPDVPGAAVGPGAAVEHTESSAETPTADAAPMTKAQEDAGQVIPPYETPTDEAYGRLIAAAAAGNADAMRDLFQRLTKCAYLATASDETIRGHAVVAFTQAQHRPVTTSDEDVAYVAA